MNISIRVLQQALSILVCLATCSLPAMAYDFLYDEVYEEPPSTYVIEYRQLPKMACIGAFVDAMPEGPYIITTQDEYEALEMHFKSPHAYCEDFILPPVEFAKEMVLGHYASGTGTDVDFAKVVLRDYRLKKLDYIITIISHGRGEILAETHNWIVIPKVPESYKINIIVQ